MTRPERQDVPLAEFVIGRLAAIDAPPLRGAVNRADVVGGSTVAHEPRNLVRS